MKNIFFTIFVFIFIILFSPQSGFCQGSDLRKDIGVFIGLGLTSGNDYSDDIKSSFDDVKGYLGWVNVNTGAYFRIISKLYLSPRFWWMASKMSITIDKFESTPYYRVNSIFLLGCSMKYYLSNRFYGQFSISNISTKSGINRFKFAPDGIETDFVIGYEFNISKREFCVELGYTHLPIKIPNVFVKKDYGGILLNLNTIFPLIKY